MGVCAWSVNGVWLVSLALFTIESRYSFNLALFGGEGRPPPSSLERGIREEEERDQEEEGKQGR